MPCQPRSPTSRTMEFLLRLAPDFFGTRWLQSLTGLNMASSSALHHNPCHGLLVHTLVTLTLTWGCLWCTATGLFEAWLKSFPTGWCVALLPALSLWGLLDVILHGPCCGLFESALPRASLRLCCAHSPRVSLAFVGWDPPWALLWPHQLCTTTGLYEASTAVVSH